MDFGLAFEYFILGKEAALMPLLSSVIGLDADAGFGGVLSSVVGSSEPSSGGSEGSSGMLSSVVGSSEDSGKNSGGSSGLLSSVLSS